MKKSAKIILSMLFASLLLMSCGSGQNPSNDTSAQTAKQTDPVHTVAQTDEITETEPVTTEPETDETKSESIESIDVSDIFYHALGMTIDNVKSQYGDLILIERLESGVSQYEIDGIPGLRLVVSNTLDETLSNYNSVTSISIYKENLKIAPRI